MQFKRCLKKSYNIKERGICQRHGNAFDEVTL
jgi:hypothetical protein